MTQSGSPCRATPGCVRHSKFVRTGAAQNSLGIDQRAANRAGSRRARRSIDELRVVIVDDVVPTGATLDEAARAVRAAGGEVDHAVTLAATPRYFEPRR